MNRAAETALRGTAAAVSGLALSAAFEPIAWPALLPLAVAGFALATSGLGVLRAGLVGWAFGVAFFFTHIAWMRTSIGPDAWFGLSLLESLAYGVIAAGLPLVRLLPAWPLWAAAVWTCVEGVRSTWPFSGMPWGRLAFAAIDTPVAPAVTYLGMTGLSFALALLGFCLAATVEALRRRRREPRTPARALVRPAAGLLGVLALLLLPAAVPFPAGSQEGPPAGSQEGASAGRSAQVSVVQGDVPGPGNDILFDPRGVTTNHAEATLDLADDVGRGEVAQPDFVIWPENSTAVDPFADSAVNAQIRNAVEQIGVPVVVGGIVDEGEEHVLNQGIVWDPVTGPGDRYTKHHPVPYGEYIPLRHLWNPQFGRLSEIRRDMMAGSGSTPLAVAGVALADAICFDIAYDDVVPRQVAEGAELITVQTSNASFIFTHQIEQQFAITRLRALEAGRWLVVASTNGRTGVIAPDGSVVSTAEPRTTAVLSATVELIDVRTPAVRLGPWPGRVFIVLSLVGLVLGGLAYRRSRKDAGSAPPGDRSVAQGPAPTMNEAHGG